VRSDRDLVRAATFVVREFRAIEGQVAGVVQMLAQS
jgi:DNA-binding FrmR family transcriptional regulator